MTPPYINPDLNAEALDIVNDYIQEHLDKSDPNPAYKVYIVWQCHILGNRKWLMSSTLPDGMYYEVTYDSRKGVCYLDAYKKFENREIPIRQVRPAT